MSTKTHHKTISELQQSWIWIDEWTDNSNDGSAAGVISFHRSFELETVPSTAVIHLTADTRYKLVVNGRRVAVGPTRSVPSIWHYDTLDLAPFLVSGSNQVDVRVIRYFPSSRAGLPFVRSSTPGLSVVGQVGDIDVSTRNTDTWTAKSHQNITFPTSEPDDVFLHISERVTIEAPKKAQVILRPIFPKNGEQGPVRLRPRAIPMPQESVIGAMTPVAAVSQGEEWHSFFAKNSQLRLTAGRYTVDVQPAVHSTAFLRWTFRSDTDTRLKLKVTYSEGYEREPRMYPWLRTKDDRRDTTGLLIGPSDQVELNIPAGVETVYEPFWFRTFGVMRWSIEIIGSPIELLRFDAAQVNYPMDVKAEWMDQEEPDSQAIFDVSVRTLRNCMFDGYADCPFYEQLQYSGDTRFVALFHYLLSGDDRLARQAITLFASSVSPEGLLQSRVPSHVQQIILGFSLYWILMVSDHYLYFGDQAYTRSFLPIIDGILEYFESHIDELGLVSGISPEIWQYIDWVKLWAPGPNDGDKGVPPSGRASNRHTFFSLLYVYTLREAATLLDTIGRRGLVEEYRQRGNRVAAAIQQHCFDGTLYTDSTADIADQGAYSWHCQIFAILGEVVTGAQSAELIIASRKHKDISVCSYAMRFYEFRAFAKAGMYDTIMPNIFDPWKAMLRNNMTTWAEDDIRQRSDCHAWSAVPLYEYLAEFTGLQPLEPGCKAISFAPRIHTRSTFCAKVCLGEELVAEVQWTTNASGIVVIRLFLTKKIRVKSVLPGLGERDEGQSDKFEWSIQLHRT